MSANFGISSIRTLRPLAIAAAIGIAAIAPAKANSDNTFAPFSYVVQLNLSDVQADLEDDLNAFRQDERCGSSWSVTDARITPVPNGRTIRVDFRARISETQCTYTRRPVTERDGQRSRNRARDELVGEATTASHVTFAIDFSPKVTGNNISLEGKVVTADTSGALNRLKLDARIKELVTNKVLDAIEERIKPTIPSGLTRGNAKLGEVSFVDIGGGKLGLSLKSSGRVRVSS